MNYKDFQGVVAAMERVNIGQRTVNLKEIFKVISYHWEINRGVCHLKALQQKNMSHLLVSQKIPSSQENQN